MKHRPEIDGLRTVAVAPVMLYHAGTPGFSGGWLGVDVFFVISGYLIGAILIAEMAAGDFSFARFYARRARRIMPALIAVILACIPAGWLLMRPGPFEDFLVSGLATLAFVSNIHFWREVDYFNTAADQAPLLHTWSLAVEEQFYILFPVLLLLLMRRRALVGPALLALAALSLAVADWAAIAKPDANFFLPATRLWELLAGALLAWAEHRGHAPRRGAAAGALAGLGLVAVVVPMAVYDTATPAPSLWTLIPVLGTAAVLRWGRDGIAGRLLSTAPFVWIGLISYSAYLWHQPVLAFARIAAGGEPALWIMLALCAVSLALAWATWAFVERPFRRGAPAPGWGPALRYGAAMTALGAALAALLGTGMQRDAYMAALSPRQAQVFAALSEMRAHQRSAALSDGDCRFRDQEASEAFRARFDACAAKHGKALLLLGDSHGIDFYDAVLHATDRPFVVGLVQAGCRAHSPKGPGCDFNEAAAFALSRAAQVEAAFYMQAAFYLMQTPDGREVDRTAFRRKHVPDTSVHAANVDRVLAALAPLSGAMDLTWVGPWLEPHLDLDQLMSRDCAGPGPDLPEGRAERYAALDRALAERAAAAGIAYVSVQEVLAFDAREDMFDCGAVYWSDGDHWSPAGQAHFGARLGPLLP
ncbi:acyltransferase family protein [Rhodovulum sp. DZ06]|uniref:acyltransferase family protein n=1 Tax=Rhodovulum sp. DZ06 TaxID=3425126 RepID=UPI003D32E12E